MGRLPNHLWRRAVELFLLAGKKGNDGALPPVEEMVWILRLSQDKLLKDLHDLAEVGVVQESEPKTWMVTHFSKRQAAIPIAERVRRSRDSNEYVTNRYNFCNEAGGVDSSSTSPSEYKSDSVSVSGEGVPGEGPLLPLSPAEAMVHPDVRIYTAVTGGRIPGLSQYRLVIETVRLLRAREKLDDAALRTYLMPYWLAWSSRRRQDGRLYDPGNISWLTEWALNESIPPIVKAGATGQDRAEVIRKVARGQV